MSVARSMAALLVTFLFAVGTTLAGEAGTALKAILPKCLGPGENTATWFVHEGLISGGKAARAGWRAFFAEAQLRWHEATAQEGGITS